MHISTKLSAVKNNLGEKLKNGGFCVIFPYEQAVQYSLSMLCEQHYL